MSDTWYREALDLPPYEMRDGSLWTWDGICLNPVQSCEPPAWYHELASLEIQAEYSMQLAQWIRDCSRMPHMAEAWSWRRWCARR